MLQTMPGEGGTSNIPLIIIGCEAAKPFAPEEINCTNARRRGPVIQTMPGKGGSSDLPSIRIGCEATRPIAPDVPDPRQKISATKRPAKGASILSMRSFEEKCFTAPQQSSNIQTNKPGKGGQ